MASSDSSRPTPLGVARARFVDGLVRKAQELRGSLALLAATPSEERPREEMRRRLHALYASAQVFQLEALAGALKDAIARLDSARGEKRALSHADLDALASLAATLPALGAEGPRADPELVAIPSAPPPPAMLRSGRTGRTLPQGLPAARPPGADVEAEPDIVPGPEPEPAPAGRALVVPQPVPLPPSLAPGEGAEGRASLPARLVESIRADRGPTTTARAPVLSVLVVDAPEVHVRARALLPSERFEVLGASEPEEALRLARSSAPDVVLVDHAILARLGSDFVRRLRDDPLTDFVPIVALLPPGASVDAIAMRELGAADALVKPLEEGPLARMVSHLGGGGVPTVPGGLGGDLTIEEIARRIADEIQRGLVEAVDAGRGVSVPLGDGSEVLAAAWSAIGRVRAHLAQRSGGRIHFRERGGAPSTLALVDDEGPETSAADVSLRERRVLVVDDDPAVVWFFAGLLREAGAIVEEAHDGAEALARARATRPDVVVTDILMPEIDGFALLREVKRDPVLADVPVILLSWKEDFLQRMRELQSGASAYLRKEAGAAQVLSSVREVLRPRARLEARVRAGGDVRGRLERIGVIPLLRTVAQLRPDARITVRDAWNLFEIDLRGGQLVDLTRTASDGSFSRGARVVPSLLGATEGRFTVAEADAPVRASVKQPLDELLVESAARLGAVVDAVSGRGLALAAKVELDEDVVASMSRASPQHVGEVVRALGEGRGPRDLLVDGTYAPNELESVLVDLARQGAITAVSGPGGEDRIEVARRARAVTRLPDRTPSLAPGAPGVAPVAGGHGPTPPAAAADERAAPSPPAAEPAPEAPAPPSAAAPAQPARPTDEAADDEADEDADDEAVTAPGTVAAAALPALAEPPEPDADDRAGVRAEREAAGGLGAPGSARSRGARAPARAEDAPATPAAPAPSPRKSASPVAAPKRSAPPPPPARAADPDGGLGVVASAFVLLLLAIAGYVGYRLFFPSSGGSTTLAVLDAGTASRPEPPPSTDDETPPGPEGTAPAPEPAVTVSAGGAATRRGYGTDEPSIEGIAAAVGEGAIVVVGHEGASATVHVVADEGDATHELRVAPGGTASLAVPEGLYVVTFVVGDQTSVRFTRVVAGHTRRLPVPE